MMRPRGLWWVYLLVVLALAGLGAAVGQGLFGTYAFGLLEPVRACLAQQGFVPPAGSQPSSWHIAVLAECGGDFFRWSGLAMVAGAIVLPLLTLPLMAWRVWWIRVRARDAFDDHRSQLTRERFELWCRHYGLTGRRQPLLRVIDHYSRRRGAETVGFRHRREVVLIPAAHAQHGVADVDFFVLHELAHVRAKDVPWAAAVHATAHLIIPALLAVVLPLLVIDPSAFWSLYGESAVTAVVLSAAVLAARAGLLRRRELVADDAAVQTLGDPEIVRTVFTRNRQASGGNAFAAVRRLWSVHPSPAERMNPSMAKAVRWEGGFVATLTASVTAMVLGQSVATVLTLTLGFDPGTTLLVSALWQIVAFSLWAMVVIPSWVHRAGSPGAARWGPGCAAVIGLVLGFCLRPPGALTTPAHAVFADALPLLVVTLVIGSSGVMVVAWGIAASVAADARWRAARLVGGVVAVASMMAMVWAVAQSVVQWQLTAADAVVNRVALFGQSEIDVWKAVIFVLLAGVVLVAVRSTRWAEFAGATVAGAVTAALAWTLRSTDGQSDDTVNYLLGQQLWICTFAGCAAGLMVWLRRPDAHRDAGNGLAALPSALAVGLCTAAMSGYAQTFVTGQLRTLAGPIDTMTYVRVPMWQLVVVAVLVLPCLALLATVVKRAWAGRAPLLAGVGAFAVAVTLLLAGALAPVTVDRGDFDRIWARAVASSR